MQPQPQPQAQPRPLPSVAHLERDRFEAAHLRRCTPVVVRGGARHWGALQRWTVPYLRSRIGDLVVPHRRTPLGKAEVGIDDVHLGMVRADEVLRRCEEPGTQEEYIPGLSLKDVPALTQDIAAPSFVDPGCLRSVSLFVGRNTRCLGHLHPFAQAVLTQVVGDKDVDLYGPSDLDRVSLRRWYEAGFYQSRINFHADRDAPDPRLAGATRWTVRLRPGDQLFIPVHWLHVPTGLGLTASVTHWWRARMREWGGVGIGAHCLAGAGRMALSRALPG